MGRRDVVTAVGSGDWYEELFSSAEIEELKHVAKKVLAEVGEPVELTLTFTRVLAREFIETVRQAPINAAAHHQILGFVQYLAMGVAYKLGEAEDGSG